MILTCCSFSEALEDNSRLLAESLRHRKRSSRLSPSAVVADKLVRRQLVPLKCRSGVARHTTHRRKFHDQHDRSSRSIIGDLSCDGSSASWRSVESATSPATKSISCTSTFQKIGREFFTVFLSPSLSFLTIPGTRTNLLGGRWSSVGFSGDRVPDASFARHLSHDTHRDDRSFVRSRLCTRLYRIDQLK